MKAMVLRRPRPIDENPLAEAELPLPQPGPGQILLRVIACGVCHTDLHLAEGEIATPRLPLVPGHQVVGLVEVSGGGVTRYNRGDRVGVPWLYSSCGTCAYCRRGQENLCDEARFTGQHVDGGFAEYMVVPAEYAVPIPSSLPAASVGFPAKQPAVQGSSGLPDEQLAPLLCAGVIGYRSLRLSEIRPGERLGLYGFGASAHVAIQIARYWGCQVYVFTRSAEHQRHALELGAAWAGGAQEPLPAPLDSAITFAPAGWLVPEALRALRKGGTLAINAIHMSPIPEMPYHLLYGERTIRSVANATRRDAEELLHLATQIPISTEIETYPLAEANFVLQRLKRAQIRGAAVLRIAPPAALGQGESTLQSQTIP